MSKLECYLFSDATGETANAFMKAVLIQFQGLETEIIRLSNIDSEEKVAKAFPSSDHSPQLVVNSLMVKGPHDLLNQYCQEKKIALIDLFTSPLKTVEELTGVAPLYAANMNHQVDTAYLDKMSHIEFAMRYDDGRDPRGFLYADVVLIGVSRTSKTPLSMYLANKKADVANMPLLPEIPLPKELRAVDPRRLFGLIIDPDRLHDVRERRVKILGLGEEASYAADTRIHEELDYARRVFDQLGCQVIDVTDSTIERTATRIMDSLQQSFGSHWQKERK